MSDIEDFSSKFLNEFTVINILGEGGFGSVFEARNQLDDQSYALKRVPFHGGDTAKYDKALREVRAMSQLDHPNIVRYNSAWVERPPENWQLAADELILNGIQWRGSELMPYPRNAAFLYIQMQLCSHALSKWLDVNCTQPSREPSRMIAWFKQIVCAVSYIHAKNFIHRDLKPENILFTEEDNLKICDLGIVTESTIVDGEEIIVSRTSIGTRLYMSPEQRSGISRYGSKTDVFTLGLILAELCVAMTKHEKIKLFKYYRRGMQRDLNTTPEIKTLVESLCQKLPEDRPSCNEILNKLGSF